MLKPTSPLDSLASSLGTDLDNQLLQLGIAGKTDGGIGIHLCGYENVCGVLVPELFLITNFGGPPNYAVGPKINISRETCKTVNPNGCPHGSNHIKCRQDFSNWLKNSPGLIFTNGGPEWFWISARPIITLMKMGKVTLSTQKTAIAAARLPIRFASTLIKDLFPANTKRIGGKTHCRFIDPTGNIFIK